MTYCICTNRANHEDLSIGIGIHADPRLYLYLFIIFTSTRLLAALPVCVRPVQTVDCVGRFICVLLSVVYTNFYTPSAKLLHFRRSFDSFHRCPATPVKTAGRQRATSCAGARRARRSRTAASTTRLMVLIRNFVC